jgi:hypothetical protein
MTLLKPMRGAGAILALTGMLVMSAQPVLAQVQAPPPSGADAQASAAPAGPAQTNPNGGRRVMLGDYALAIDPVTGEREMAPRPITSGDIGFGVQVMDEEEYAEAYPLAARLGWFEQMRRSDRMLCDYGNSLVNRLLHVDANLLTADQQLVAIQAIYNELPAEIRANTRVVRTAAVVGGVAGCVLSLGLYCIMAASNTAQSWANAGVYERINLAHVKVALINVGLQRDSVELMRINIDATLMWIIIALPFCEEEQATVGAQAFFAPTRLTIGKFSYSPNALG